MAHLWPSKDAVICTSRLRKSLEKSRQTRFFCMEALTCSKCLKSADWQTKIWMTPTKCGMPSWQRYNLWITNISQGFNSESAIREMVNLSRISYSHMKFRLWDANLLNQSMKAGFLSSSYLEFGARSCRDLLLEGDNLILSRAVDIAMAYEAVMELNQLKIRSKPGLTRKWQKNLIAVNNLKLKHF